MKPRLFVRVKEDATASAKNDVGRRGSLWEKKAHRSQYLAPRESPESLLALQIDPQAFKEALYYMTTCYGSLKLECGHRHYYEAIQDGLTRVTRRGWRFSLGSKHGEVLTDFKNTLI